MRRNVRSALLAGGSVFASGCALVFGFGDVVEDRDASIVETGAVDTGADGADGADRNGDDGPLGADGPVGLDAEAGLDGAVGDGATDGGTRADGGVETPDPPYAPDASADWVFEFPSSCNAHFGGDSAGRATILTQCALPLVLDGIDAGLRPGWFDVARDGHIGPLHPIAAESGDGVAVAPDGVRTFAVSFKKVALIGKATTVQALGSAGENELLFRVDATGKLVGAAQLYPAGANAGPITVDSVAADNASVALLGALPAGAGLCVEGRTPSCSAASPEGGTFAYQAARANPVPMVLEPVAYEGTATAVGTGSVGPSVVEAYSALNVAGSAPFNAFGVIAPPVASSPLTDSVIVRRTSAPATASIRLPAFVTSEIAVAGTAVVATGYDPPFGGSQTALHVLDRATLGETRAIPMSAGDGGCAVFGAATDPAARVLVAGIYGTSGARLGTASFPASGSTRRGAFVARLNAALTDVERFAVFPVDHVYDIRVAAAPGGRAIVLMRYQGTGSVNGQTIDSGGLVNYVAFSTAL